MKTKYTITILIFLLSLFTSFGQDTFSIVAVDPLTGEVGSAGASCVDLTDFPGLSDSFLGELFPGVGAINTQAYYNQTNQSNARNRMNLGDTPNQIIQWLINNDVTNQPQLRQYGIVAMIDDASQSAAHTGTATDDYKNHVLGSNYAIQGNILLGQEVLDDMESNFLNEEGSLACKLMAAMQGAKRVGADSRCTSNGTSSLFAFVKVAQPSDTFGNPSFLLSVRTANGDGDEPIDLLQTLFDNENLSCTSLSVDEVTKVNFNVYPNPTKNSITVENKGLETYKLTISNIIGRVIYENKIQNTLKIDVSTFSSGVYFISLSNDNQSFVIKMIKN
jgi:uncharacterized Ntn-hydrolase superfamily protein